MASILEVRGLRKYFGRRAVVDGVDFSVRPGEIVGLLGPNGAGKTTSFRMTTGQLTPDGGTVYFNGVEVTDWPMYRRARLGMGYLSQEQSIFRRLSVEDNILAILEALPQSRNLGRKLTRRERHERTQHVLAQFGLTHVRKTNAARCSGGEKRRLEIARCLVCEPLMILLDEPFAAVDPLTKNDIQQIVRNLAQGGISILVTDHDVDQVLEIADRVYLITEGKVRTHGAPQQIVRDPVAINEYLGQRYLDRQYRPLPAQEPVPLPDTQTALATVLEQEQIRRHVHGLMGNEEQFRRSFAELLLRGAHAVPALLEALEHKDLEARRRAFAVLQRLTNGHAVFEPHAPPTLRQQQLLRLREQLMYAQAS